MQDVPFLKDFYDKSVIPVGEKDKVMLGKLNREEGGLAEAVTHWLIALIWYEEEEAAGWKVSVYPIRRGKPFWLFTPYYETHSLYSFDIALKMSRILEAHSQKDLLTARLFYQELNELMGVQMKVSLNYEDFN